MKDDTEYEKDKVISKLIPPEVTVCPVHVKGEVCMGDGMAKEVGAVLGLPAASSKQIIETAKSKLDCNTERCVLTKLSSQLGPERVNKVIQYTQKVSGHVDTTLLSNYEIDAVLKQWAVKWPDFFAYNFNMRDYVKHSFKRGEVLDEPDTLATINWVNLYDGSLAGRKIRRSACVINSDYYHGPGKHWMALFVDASNPARWSIEFFNSSGNNPAAEWVNWMIKTRDELSTLEGAPPIDIVKVCQVRHQRSRSECGVYSLFYIWARLNGIGYGYFMENRVPDEYVMEFRHHIFDDPSRPFTGKFEFKEYSKRTEIKWE